MTATATCPVCDRPQEQGLLDDFCTTALERELGDVAAIVGELDVTLSRQARIGGGGDGKMGKGWAREKLPINLGAVEAADNLGNVLTTWARDVSGEAWIPDRVLLRIFRNVNAATSGPLCDWPCGHDSCEAMRTWETYSPPPVAAQASRYLLSHIPEIRRHPAVVELVDEITDAIRQARRAVDRPADRQFFGACYSEMPDPEGRMVTCLEEIYAHASAQEVTCKVCGTEHPIQERRIWLIGQARDMIVTVKDASTYMGDVGGIRVTEDRIRGYLKRKRIAYRPLGEKQGILLGDLWDVVIDDSERKSA